MYVCVYVYDVCPFKRYHPYAEVINLEKPTKRTLKEAAMYLWGLGNGRTVVVKINEPSVEFNVK